MQCISYLAFIAKCQASNGTNRWMDGAHNGGTGSDRWQAGSGSRCHTKACMMGQRGAPSSCMHFFFVFIFLKGKERWKLLMQLYILMQFLCSLGKGNRVNTHIYFLKKRPAIIRRAFV